MLAASISPRSPQSGCLGRLLPASLGEERASGPGIDSGELSGCLYFLIYPIGANNINDQFSNIK